MDILNEFKHGELYVKHATDNSPNDSSFPMHIHQTYEIYLFIKGRVKYLVEGSAYHLRPGSVLVIRPAESHKPKIIECAPYERYNINFPASLLKEYDPALRLLSPFDKRELGHDNMYSLSELGNIPMQKFFYDMCHSKKDAYSTELKIKTNLLYILDAINDAYERRDRTFLQSKSREETIIAYVNEHLSSELSVPKLAEQFYLSVSQFNRIFKNATGASPWEYITVKRLSTARDLIRSGMDISDVFEISGWGDYSSFYRAYTNRFGISPAEDKKVNQK